MPSPALAQTFNIYELTETILLHLPRPQDIILAQRVCRSWNSIIQTSPALQEACWYTYKYPYRHTPKNQKFEEPTQKWTLNPAFNSLGICTEDIPGFPKNRPFWLSGPGGFSLQRRVYDKPGSWTGMLATRPPTREVMIVCYGDYSPDEDM